ncbi:LPS assembly protein LptD [Roseateles sp.]|uniref:LPS assembly protein LptD n=1 Tax=Roseateles sp. TaxID=1971397 RepID=UPI002F4238A0
MLAIAATLAPAVIPALTTPAHAQERAEEFSAVDRVSVAAGVYHLRPTLSARGASPDGGASVSSFSGGSANLPRLQLDLRLFDRQGLSFDYYRYDRSDRFTGFDANGALNSKLEFGKASYRWWFGSGKTAFSLGAGASYYKASTRSHATFNAQDGSGTSLDVKGSGGKLAPFGELGLRHALSPDVRLFADASGAWRNSGGRRDSILNATVGAEWFPVHNVGLTAAYNFSDFKMKHRDEIGTFLNLRLQGPSIAMKLRF